VFISHASRALVSRTGRFQASAFVAWIETLQTWSKKLFKRSKMPTHVVRT
jgi:hypothetical protein